MKILGSPFFTIIFTISFILLLIRYWKLLKNIPLPYKLSLISLRSITLIILLLLLINPWANFKKKEQIPQNIDVIFDLSESMYAHFDKMELSIEEIIQSFSTLFDNNQVDKNFYRLGKKIQFINDNLAAIGVTDFTNLSNFMAFENPNQILLITDGKATVGRELNNINFPKNIPIHTIGVGPVISENDLAINRVIIPPRSNIADTVKLVMKVSAKIQNNAITKLDINNGNGEKIFTKSVSFESGAHNHEIEIFIPAINFSGLNNATIYSINGESQLKNNQYTFKVNVQSDIDKVIIITGALSPNSSSIKSILNSLEGIEVEHHYRIDALNWNINPESVLLGNHKLIVFDDFPSGNNDRILFDKLIQSSRSQHIPMVYLEGPKSNLTTGEIIRSQFPFFIPVAIDSEILTSLSDEYSKIIDSGSKLSAFPPQARSVKWTMDNNDWINFTDGSFMIANKNDVYMVAIPDITGNHLKTKNNLSSPIFSLLNKLFLHAYYGNEGLLAMHIDGSSFNKGEIFSAKLLPVENVGLSNFKVKVIHSNLDTVITDCIKSFPEKYYNCNLTLHSPGEFTLRGEAELPDGKKINSTNESIIVQDVNIELKELIQEQNILMQVAHTSGGIYIPIESLDSMFSNIEITPIQNLRNYQISGLSTQNYWWLLIVLLSTEWFIRKKLGLL
jgi:hypothetical protein